MRAMNFERRQNSVRVCCFSDARNRTNGMLFSIVRSDSQALLPSEKHGHVRIVPFDLKTKHSQFFDGRNRCAIQF
jgi:hypothetical protein